MASREQQIRIRVNGESRELPGEQRLVALLEQMGLDRRFLVVEHNGEPIARESFAGLVLKDGDRLELVRPVAGG